MPPWTRPAPASAWAAGGARLLPPHPGRDAGPPRGSGTGPGRGGADSLPHRAHQDRRRERQGGVPGMPPGGIGAAGRQRPAPAHPDAGQQLSHRGRRGDHRHRPTAGFLPLPGAPGADHPLVHHRHRNRQHRTTVKDIFAGGDAVTGPATVVEAIAAGKQAAVEIDHYLPGPPPRPWS